MKKIILCISISFLSFHSPAQDSLRRPNSDSIAELLNPMDSIKKKQQEENLKLDQEQNIRNLDALVKEIKERDKKAKQQMYIRLGLGLFFLIVLIVGLLRRRKKKTV